MAGYFEHTNAKSVLKTNEVFTSEGSRTDLLLDQYKLSRSRLLNDEKVVEIENMYMKWCDLLFSGFNVVVMGAQSKFSLLETFKKMFLDSEAIPDFRTATGFNAKSDASLFGSTIMEGDPSELASSSKSSKSSRKKGGTKTTKVAAAASTSRAPRRVTRRTPTPIEESAESSKATTPASMEVDYENCPMLDIVTVRLHGLDPIKTETFNHAVFDITESRKLKDVDIEEFLQRIEKNNVHYVFLIHSFEYFYKECEEICQTIFRLYSLDAIHIHLLMSSDMLNAGKKLNNLKISLRLAFFVAPFSESFLWEKTELANAFDELGDGAANETTVHRLFNERTDLQSLKDIYQALDSATASIMRYIFRDYVEKCEANKTTAEQADKQTDDEEVEQTMEEQNRRQPKRRAKASGPIRESRRTGPSKRVKKIETDLDFHHLLNHCESRFIIRRGAALRDHLGELKDHSIIADDEAGNRIRCLIEPRLCTKFLNWVGPADDD